MDKLHTSVVLLIPWLVAALVLVAMALRLFDPVIAALVLTALAGFGEAIAYSALALREAKHARAYGFIASSQWLAVVVMLALCMEFFGWWTPPRLLDGIVLNHNYPIGRQVQRLEEIHRTMTAARLNRPGSHKPPSDPK